MFKALSLALAFISLTAAAQASVIVTVSEIGSDVQFNLSGSLDLPGQAPGVGFGDASLGSSAAGEFIVIVNVNQTDVYDLVTSSLPLSFTSSSVQTSPTTTAGDPFAIFFAPTLYNGAGIVFLPDGYTSGSALSSTATFSGATFASLGLSTGTFLSTLAGTGDTITFYVGVEPPMSAIPLPASLPMLLLAGGALTVLRRRQRA